MPKTRLQKEDMVKDISEKISRSSSMVFTDYQGLTMPILSGLRNNLSGADAEFSITKNSLLKLALTTNHQLPATVLDGPTATLFSFGDEITPIKALVKALKDAQMGKIKGGFLSGEYIDADSILKLSALPSKLELQAKIIGSLASPLIGIVVVLQANLRNLVYALDQVRIQKGGES